MRPRYLILVGGGDGFAARAGRIAEAQGLRLARATPPLAVLVDAACGFLDMGADGGVVGTLFPRHGAPRAITGFEEAERDTLTHGGSQELLSSHWGGYVSAWVKGDAVEILRDPSGALPCYRARIGEIAALASDLDLLAAAGMTPAGIAWDALGRMLYSCGLPMVESALTGITTLLAGTAIILEGHAERPAPGWSPWAFVEPCASEERAATSERLRRTVEHCVSAWSSLYRRPLLSLSGGLDSSIVAACLARSKRAATCLTLHTDDPAGDERSYAALLCEALGLPLAEWRYDLGAVDLGHALGAHLPRPIGRAEAQPYEAAHRAVAARVGADAFFSGNGGDNVFGFSQSAVALADRALHEGPGAGAFATLRDICRQTGAGPLRVVRAATRIARQPPAYRWKPSPALLHPELIASLRDFPLVHPWLEAPAWVLPGKAVHIAGIARAHPNLESDRGRIAHLVNPLLSQPIIEVCLSIPSWQWREGGRDRAMARTAFAGMLPQAIVERKVKGTPDPFCGEIVRRKRQELRERLLGGRLAAHRILDPDAVDETLRADRATTSEENVRLLELINAEAWAGRWS
ncbi:asparagine synthase-related protein [Sphingomonas mali]|uniref:asparagine synthase-related protein n=1 Tax=Sphingomonas mali TaxID=40682 RepID=UPI00082F93B0|nr:asparagine synthase-related protein [Sphingomonas mali]